MFLKRLFDIILSCVGLVIFLPLLLFIAGMIKIRMPGPVFFSQERTGRYGRPFRIYKFRSMVMHHLGGSVSVQGEKRITPFGAFLRKYKLDELPELWNIFIGDMSFVGPRPDMPEYYDRLSDDEKRIFSLRPGLTGPASLKYYNEEELLAQVPDPVKYNDEVIWPDKVRMNLAYYNNRTFIMDLKILLKTIFH